MKNLPKIRIIKNNILKMELEIFSSFLNHPRYPQKRNSIFLAFPNLQLELKKLVNKKEEKKIVNKFICDFYSENRERIDQIMKESENIFKDKGGVALETIANLMNYKWDRLITYYAIPTILPFSPFNKRGIFNFSILNRIILKNDGNNSLFIAIHEISHLIFLDIIKKKNLTMNDDLTHYLKETLTFVLLNRSPLFKILGLNYGNLEIRDLYIEKTNSRIIKFTKFVEDYYLKIRKNNFNVFLKEIINILNKVSNEFSIKRKIWNQYGNKLKRNDEIFKKYTTPIKL